MHIPKANTKQIYQYLMNEGVIVVKKDVNAPKHDDLPIPNLQVMKTLQSLCSCGYVKVQFSWHHFYYFLTDEGIIFLRKSLNLPDSVVPVTLNKPAGRPAGASSFGGEEGGEGRRRAPRAEGERGAWRSRSERVAA